VLEMPLPAKLTKPFLSLAGNAGASPFMAFLAAVFVLLSRWSGQADFVLGAPFAGRTRSDLEDQLGCFVNSLPLRGRVTREDSFLDVLARLRDICLDALEHQLCPFDVIVRDAAEAHQADFGPLFDVMVVVQNAPESRLAQDLRDVAIIETELDQSKLDLIFTFAEQRKGWLLSIHYDATLFVRGAVKRLSDQFTDMVRGFVERPAARLAEPLPSDLPMMAGEGTGGTLHAAFEAWARDDPGRTAIVFGECRRSYGALDLAATRLARAIGRIAPGVTGVVAICLDRSDRVVEAQLAVLKAGHAFLVLQPDDPPERLAWLLADSGALVLIEAAGRPCPAAAPGDCRRLALDSADPADCAAERDTAASVVPGDAAYFIYTSGSTGRPKGVVVAHASACSLVAAAEAVIPPHAGEVWSVFHAFAFDFSIWETFMPLSRGATAVLASERVRRNPGAFARLAVEEAVTVLSQVPSAFEHLGPALVRERPRLLRWIVFGGEPVNPLLLRQVMPQLPEIAFLNGYGITETTVFSTFKRLDGGMAQQNIGRPLGNQQIWIMDDRLCPVLPGAVGEICISGTAVARGYLNLPDLTARRFVHWPGRSGTRLYRSGDFGRWNADGDLVFLGRRDRQVKRSGHRIELDEIRTVALASGAVEDCAVVASPGPAGEPDIVAFVIAREDAAVENMRAHLLRVLPGYMIPARIIALESFPRLENGKTDLARLEGQASDTLPSAPRAGNGAEGQILEAMRTAIGRPGLGPQDDFFHAGGHSLAAIRVLAETEAALGVRLELEAMFERPTAHGLAKLVGEMGAAMPSGQTKAPAPGFQPASPVQAGLWAIEQFRPPGLPAALPERYVFTEEIDRDLCTKAFAAVFARFDIFRTTFALEAGTLVQRVDAPGAAGARFRIVDPGVQEDPEAVARIVGAETAAAFDLAEGPLIRFSMLAGGTKPPVLICAAHHAVWDGASLDLTMAAWEQAYAALAAGRPPPPRAEHEQYATFLRFQQERAVSPTGEAALAFWRKRCDGTGGIPQIVATVTGREGFIGLSHGFALDHRQIDHLRNLCGGSGATLFAGVQALARSWLWLRWAKADAAIGSPVMTRQSVDFAATPGPFLNHLVLRLAVGGADDLRQIIARAANEIRLGLKHALTPPELVTRPGASRPFDLGLTLQSLRDEWWGPGHPGDGTPVFGIHTPLWLDITPAASALRCALVSNLDYFDVARARDLADDAYRTFCFLIDESSMPLAEIAPHLQAGFPAKLNLE